MSSSDGGTFLEELSRDLSGKARALAEFARRDALWRRVAAGEKAVSVQEVEALIEARHARSEMFQLDLVSPGWSLLLELFRVHLQGRAVRLPRLAEDARVPASTALRWVEQFYAAGLAERIPDPERVAGILVRMTEAGGEAMHAYFARAMRGWIID